MRPSLSTFEGGIPSVDPVRLYRRLLELYGPQGWWPGGGGFEIFVGALLVQRTTWRNAEAAIGSLRAAELLAPAALAQAPLSRIQTHLMGCGFHATKSRRLKAMARWFVAAGGYERLAGQDTGWLRQALLALEGVGDETADAILLYAFDRPAVVVDESLRRLLSRVSGMKGAMPDAAVRRIVAGSLRDVAELNEFHALVVEHGKTSCRKRPVCDACGLRDLCRTGRGLSDA